MAYTAPELLLVGAAQHLILDTSPDPILSFCDELSPETEMCYDSFERW
jgi:hypothetical protein